MCNLCKLAQLMNLACSLHSGGCNLQESDQPQGTRDQRLSPPCGYDLAANTFGSGSGKMVLWLNIKKVSKSHLMFKISVDFLKYLTKAKPCCETPSP